MVLDSVTNEYGVGRVRKKSGNLEKQDSGGGECRVGIIWRSQPRAPKARGSGDT